MLWPLLGSISMRWSLLEFFFLFLRKSIISSDTITQEHERGKFPSPTSTGISYKCSVSVSYYYFFSVCFIMGLPYWLSDKESACLARRYRRRGSNPWVRKSPWRKAWLLIPGFSPGESHGSEEPGGLQSMGSQRVKYDWSNWAQPSTCSVLESPWVHSLSEYTMKHLWSVRC